jgi:hypothetical protein
VSECASRALGPHVRIVGVVHPGAGGKGGSSRTIIADFKRALGKVTAWAADDRSWLPVDEGGTRGTADSYKYRSAPIPFRDLPYGISWRVGQGGTSSNRKDAQRGIQMFSESGDYAATVPYPHGASGSNEGYSQDPGDLPYEPPRENFSEFDPGPPETFAQLMMGGEPGLAWPDFASLGVSTHESFGYGPIYRGRPDSARALIFADQDSHDDLFTGRAFTGNGGQHFQRFLGAMGLDRSYVILRALPVDTLDLPSAKVDEIVDHPQVKKVYQAIAARVLEQGQTAVVLTIGPHSKRLAAHVLPGAGRLEKHAPAVEDDVVSQGSGGDVFIRRYACANRPHRLALRNLALDGHLRGPRRSRRGVG